MLLNILVVVGSEWYGVDINEDGYYLTDENMSCPFYSRDSGDVIAWVYRKYGPLVKKVEVSPYNT
jgi:hypothetical protein